MKIKALLLVFTAVMLFSVSAEAQSLPRRVRNVEVQDLDAQKARLPWWGEKNLMIFYVDPDVPKQNDEFITHIEETKRLAGPNIEGFGIINLKDTTFPSSVVRQIADARTAKNGATILCDPDHWLSSAWRLGDCNDSFVIMLINKQGQLVYIHKGEMSKEEQEKFLAVGDTLKDESSK
jgi:predicted transcriptional regulator